MLLLKITTNLAQNECLVGNNGIVFITSASAGPCHQRPSTDLPVQHDVYVQADQYYLMHLLVTEAAITGICRCGRKNCFHPFLLDLQYWEVCVNLEISFIFILSSPSIYS